MSVIWKTRLSRFSRHQQKSAWFRVGTRIPGPVIVDAALIKAIKSALVSPAGAQVDLLRTTIRQHFPALDPFWNTGYGLALQRVDADICERLQRKLRDRGVPALSVHDSFVVPQSARELTISEMTAEFDRACRQLRART